MSPGAQQWISAQRTPRTGWSGRARSREGCFMPEQHTLNWTEVKWIGLMWMWVLRAGGHKHTHTDTHPPTHTQETSSIFLNVSTSMPGNLKHWIFKQKSAEPHWIERVRGRRRGEGGRHGGREREREGRKREGEILTLTRPEEERVRGVTSLLPASLSLSAAPLLHFSPRKARVHTVSSLSFAADKKRGKKREKNRRGLVQRTGGVKSLKGKQTKQFLEGWTTVL